MAVSILQLYKIVQPAKGRQQVKVFPLSQDPRHLRNGRNAAILPEGLYKSGKNLVGDALRGNLPLPGISVYTNPSGPELLVRAGHVQPPVHNLLY